MTRLIILAGAPESKDLDWDEKAMMKETATEVSGRGSIDSVRSNDSIGSESSIKPVLPRWRRIEMDKLRMKPIRPEQLKLDLDSLPNQLDLSQPTEFLTPSELVSSEHQEAIGSDVSAEDSRPSQESYEPETEALADYYEHSFSIHEAIPTSQISESSILTPGTPIYESSEEMFEGTTTPGGSIMRTTSQRRLSQAPKPDRLTNLNEIPNANALRSWPVMKTVNLIVGLLSMGPPKLVTVGARWGRPQQCELIELLVGDDTKTGFTITMWLPREMRVNWKDGAQEKPEGGRSRLRRSLREIRQRDVLLIQNVALSQFRGKVHGQSLRRDVTRVQTLFRKKVEDEEQAGCYTAQNLKMATSKDAQILKVKRVRDWLLEFAGEPAAGGGRKGGKKKGLRMLLPDDTQ